MKYIFILLLTTSIANAQQKDNPYFNQPVPKDTPVIFSMGVISD